MASCVCNSLKLVPRIVLKRSRLLNCIAAYNNVSVACLQTSALCCKPSAGQRSRNVEDIAGVIGSKAFETENAIRREPLVAANQEVRQVDQNASLEKQTENSISPGTAASRLTAADVDHVRDIYSESGVQFYMSPKKRNSRNMYLSNSESLLKKLKVIPCNVDVFQSYCEALGVDFNTYRARLMHSVNLKQISLEMLRMQVQASYLGEKFQKSTKEMYTVLLRKNIVVSMKHIRNSLQAFADLGFDSKRVFTNIEVFRVGPRELASFVEFSKSDTTGTILRAAQKNPRLILQDLSMLHANLALLKSSFPFSVNESNYFIASVLKLQTSELQRRIKAIEAHSQLGFLMSSPRILEIVARFPQKRSLDNWYQQYGYDSPSLNTLLRRTYIQKEESKRLYLQKDLIYFIEQEFLELKISAKAIALSLRQHPYWLKVQLESCVATYNYLLKERNISKSTLACALPIILYPINKISTVWGYAEAARSDPSDPAFLHLLLYYLEKPYDFTGEGIWEWEPPEADLDPCSDFSFSKQADFNEDCDNFEDEEEWNEDLKEPDVFDTISERHYC